MEPVTVSLCTDCGHCPEVAIRRDCVTIGENDNLVRLSHAEWNRLVALVQSGKQAPVK